MDWLSIGIFACVNSHQHQFYAAVEGPLFVTEMDQVRASLSLLLAKGEDT